MKVNKKKKSIVHNKPLKNLHIDINQIEGMWLTLVSKISDARIGGWKNFSVKTIMIYNGKKLYPPD